jgi:phosphoglycerol transferase MdoB-like AlkP superfamily enzyme
MKNLKSKAASENTGRRCRYPQFYHLLSVYLLAMGIFTLFRLLLLAFHLDQLHDLGAAKWQLVGRALWMGVRFDTVISCYILLLPVVAASVLLWLGRLTPLALQIEYAAVMLLFSVTFLLCTVDIPFFNHFFVRLNSSVFTWIDHPKMALGMIFTEPRFVLFLFVFIFFAGLYCYLMLRIRRSHLLYLPCKRRRMPGLLLWVGAGMLLWGAMFLGIRGRISKKSPIRVGTAYFSSKPFINYLGLNPAFSLMRSCMDAQKEANRRMGWMPDSEALGRMAKILRHDETLDTVSPIARRLTPHPIAEGYNLVLVIMEGLSAEKMARFGNPNHLTPFLDSLAGQSYFFSSMYSAGIHTHNGIYSVLFGHPALMVQHGMKQYFSDKMAGLPNILYQNGYQTAFFIPHDEQFDNIGGFLSSNDVMAIIAQKDYPAKEVRGAMGVPDEFMFRFSIPVLSAMAERGAPFFAAMMTASDHEPYVLPDDVGFEPRNHELPKQMTEFADWSLRRFMQYASEQPWYERTVFAFTADHGGIIGRSVYDISLTYHHIPFMIYIPGRPPEEITTLGVQADVTPTLASLLGISCINNTFGIDLLHDARRYAVFSSDYTLACLSDSLLFLYNKDFPDKLYRYREKDAASYRDTFPALSDEMKAVAFSWLQTSQWMIENRKTSLPRFTSGYQD